MLLAAVSCATSANVFRREVVVTTRPFVCAGRRLSYVEGAPKDAAAHLPLVVFVESDGARCRPFDATRWSAFVQRFTGDFRLVRPRTREDTACGSPQLKRLDFLQRVDELQALVTALSAKHPRAPLFLVGEAAGAEVAILWSHAHPRRARGLVDLGGGVADMSKLLAALPDSRAGVVGTLRALRDPSRDEEPLWGRTRRFWRQLFFSGVGPLWRAAGLPVLVVEGAEDHAAPEESMRLAEQEFERAGVVRVRFDFVPGVGRDLLVPAVWRDVSAWMRRTLRP